MKGPMLAFVVVLAASTALGPLQAGAQTPAVAPADAPSRAVVPPNGEPGIPIVISGIVSDASGSPLRGASVYVYQTDARGYYDPSNPRASDVVFLALHPPTLREALPAIRRSVTARTLVVSLAPKVTLGELESGCGTARVARIIPNAPSIVGQGYNPVSFSPGTDTAGRAEVLRLREVE